MQREVEEGDDGYDTVKLRNPCGVICNVRNTCTYNMH